MEKLTGISNTDLLGERPLSVVLVEMFKWMEIITREYIESTSKQYFPGICSVQQHNPHDPTNYTNIVLVAHNGFQFDFPILLSEMERRREHFSTSLNYQYFLGKGGL